MKPFNSRPHTEVDSSSVSRLAGKTPFNSRPHTEVDLQMIYGIRITGSFNSRPHTEVDINSCSYIYRKWSFQLTTSHGGRPIRSGERDYCYYLSTHDLTRRSTRYILGIAAELFFQLTTSHGGRLRLYDFPRRVDPFNSRPHTEVDSPRRHRRSSL